MTRYTIRKRLDSMPTRWRVWDTHTEQFVAFTVSDTRIGALNHAFRCEVEGVPNPDHPYRRDVSGDPAVWADPEPWCEDDDMAAVLVEEELIERRER